MTLSADIGQGLTFPISIACIHLRFRGPLREENDESPREGYLSADQPQCAGLFLRLETKDIDVYSRVYNVNDWKRSVEEGL